MDDSAGPLIPKDGRQATFRVYPARWVVLAIFSMGNFMNAISWLCFASVSTGIGNFYGISNQAVNALSVIFMAWYVPGTLIAAWGLERYGLRGGTLTGSALNFACGLIRWLSVFMAAAAAEGSAGDSARAGAYAVLFIGQFLGAFAQPFFTNAPAKVAAEWFPPAEREMATTIAAMVNPLGNAVATVLPAIIMPSEQPATTDVSIMLGFQAVLSGVLLVAAVFGAQSKPPTPPSAGAASRDLLRTESIRLLKTGASMRDMTPMDIARLSSPKAQAASRDAEAAAATGSPLAVPAAVPVKEEGRNDEEEEEEEEEEGGMSAVQVLLLEARALLSDPNYWLMAMAFGLGLGLFNAFLTLILQVIEPCGYGSGQAGTLGGLILVAGLVGAGIAGPIMEKTKAYGVVMKVDGVLACIFTVVMVLTIQRHVFGLMCAAAGLMGFFLIPLLPIVFENSAEYTYPTNEETGTGVLMVMGQLFGILFTVTLPPVIATDTCDTFLRWPQVYIGTIMLIVLSMIGFFKPMAKRHETEKAHKQLADEHHAATTAVVPPALG